MQNDEKRIAVFIDFENVAMGVRESKYGNFNIDLVLKRLVEKGKIMVKRAYSDWHRYAEFKRAFHQAAIELIDVPQTRYSGKNSADIRMVVDALDLSYQKDHIDTFVLVSGDSDFSPLVSKLRENGRYVIGMGVKQSSSDLLINNCDEFIFYEDLVRPATVVTVVDPQMHHLSPKKAEAIRLVLETFQALQREGKEVIYGSMIKQTLIRKLPSFNETYYGYPMFSRLLEDAEENKLLKLAKDQKSGGYIVTPPSDVPATVAAETGPPTATAVEAGSNGSAGAQAAGAAPAESRDRFRRGRWDRSRPRRGDRHGDASQPAPPSANMPDSARIQSASSDSASEPMDSNQSPSVTDADPDPAHAAAAEHNITEVESAVAEPTAAEAQALDPGPAVPEAEPAVAEPAASPAPRNPQRGRGRRRSTRFRQAASGSAKQASAATGADSATQAPDAKTDRETASTGSTANEPTKEDDNKSVASVSSKTTKTKTASRPRRARSSKPGGNRKKPA